MKALDGTLLNRLLRVDPSRVSLVRRPSRAKRWRVNATPTPAQERLRLRSGLPLEEEFSADQTFIEESADLVRNDWDENDWLIFEDAQKLDADGKPKLVYVDLDEYAVLEPKYVTEEYMDGLEKIDVAPFGPPDPDIEVPGNRVIVDSEELDLIGEGLPITNGEEWPQMYWKAIEDISAGKEVRVPVPHGKFNLQDLRRIRDQGPSFGDLVLTHAERTYEPPQQPVREGDNAYGESYNYIPFSVMGDYTFAAEPNWLHVPRMSFAELYQGMRERNWMCDDYRADAPPWRVQFYQCGYDAVTHWPGYRALVTRPGGLETWTDMPLAGPETFTKDFVAMAGQGAVWANKRGGVEGLPVERLGWRQVFEQIFQAYEQRLSVPEAVAFAESAALPPGEFEYDCPGESLLDVSWHRAGNAVTNPWVQWAIQPDSKTVIWAIQYAMDNSGIFEMKLIRDLVAFKYLPTMPQININFKSWGMTNYGLLYFSLCVILGVVIPALRRSSILDISTLEEDFGAAQEFAKSKATARREGLTGAKFSDVAGLNPILNEVMEVVEFLKDPRLFSKLGARPPKGILFEGDPGTGKTLMAKALAGEAMVPFYQMTGTEFTEGIVGVGAARVRDLFKRARLNAPCVIFVDELDALGQRRSSAEGNANEEREQTLNQLLTEMDGFTPDTGVVFIGATNRADLLDPALMRPGRFDRKIRMPKPDTEGRYDILRLQLRDKRVADDVDLEQLARDLPGLVGADIANIINEATLHAVRDGRSMLTRDDLNEGVDRFTQGELRAPLPTRHKRPVLVFAAKEAAIALVGAELRRRSGRLEAVERVSVVPKGGSYSRTLFARGTDEEYTMMTRGKMLDHIKVAMAGSIGVKVILGDDTIFSIPDIKRAQRMAEKMVFYYGMSGLGVTSWAKQPYSADQFGVGQRPRKVMSQDAMLALADWPSRVDEFRFDPLDPSDPTWFRYQDEVRRIIKSCYEEVWNTLEEHREALWAGITALSEKKEMLGGELRDVFDRYPPRTLARRKTLEMEIFTDGKNAKWPYGIEWLNDTYPIPHWVREGREPVRGRDGAAAAASSGSGSGGGGGGGGGGTAVTLAPPV